MEWVLGLLVVVTFGWAGYLGIRSALQEEKKKKMRVQCESCGVVMTYGRWKEHEGCLQCGSDLFSVELGGVWSRGLTKL